MVFGFPLSDYDCGIKRSRIESPVRLSSLPLPRTARVACYDRLRDSAIRAAAAPVFRAAVPYCVGAGVPDGPLLVPFMPLAGIFRAPARHPFARGGKRMQKRRQRPMVFGFPLFPCDHAAKRPTRNCLRAYPRCRSHAPRGSALAYRRRVGMPFYKIRFAAARILYISRPNGPHLHMPPLAACARFDNRQNR